jgi:hypothetical protein
MDTIRLIRQQKAPGRSGPEQGMFVLQRALASNLPEWLAIGGKLQPHDIPWYWHWDDAAEAALRASTGRPVIVGPNILFRNSRKPRSTAEEQGVCDGPGCLALVTESTWYAELIRDQLCQFNRAQILVWPYPVELPEPSDHCNDEERYDVLIYRKSGCDDATIESIWNRWPRCREIRYGSYRRQRLIDAAARSRVCFYCSDDDRGPLALAEILMTGCPAVGISRGAPWIVDGVNGYQCDRLDNDGVLDALARAMEVSRETAAMTAMEWFSPDRVAAQAVSLLGSLLEFSNT